MNKKTLGMSIAMAVVMILLPLAYLFAPSHWGMPLMVMSFLAINPVFSGIVGWFTGGDIRGRWAFPLVNAALFLVTASCIFGIAPAFAVYALFYVGIGYALMGIRKLFPKD